MDEGVERGVREDDMKNEGRNGTIGEGMKSGKGI